MFRFLRTAGFGSIFVILICFQYSFVLGVEQQFENINGVAVYKSIGKYNLVFRNFKILLTPKNTLLPSNPKIVSEYSLKRKADNYRKEIADKQSINFKKYGQFEIFIPVDKFPLVNRKSGYVTVRMPQTLVDNRYSPHSKDPRRYDYVAEKQALYMRIKEMVTSKKGEVEVVLEFPYQKSKVNCYHLEGGSFRDGL